MKFFHDKNLRNRVKQIQKLTGEGKLNGFLSDDLMLVSTFRIDT